MVNSDSIKGTRKEYLRGALVEAQTSMLPLEQFKNWFKEAVIHESPEPNAFALSTVSASGKPSSRIVLMKYYDDRGFVFFTNYASRKGEDIVAQPLAAMLFYWPTLERQVRIEGLIERVLPKESDDYFGSRPKSARLAAIASKQSTVASSREEIDSALEIVSESYRTSEPQRPDNWGGYRIKPHRFEFWQGRESRMHDRIFFEYINNTWTRGRLWP